MMTLSWLYGCILEMVKEEVEEAIQSRLTSLPRFAGKDVDGSSLSSRKCLFTVSSLIKLAHYIHHGLAIG